MNKNRKQGSKAKNRGLLTLLAVCVLLTAPKNPAIAQTLSLPFNAAIASLEISSVVEEPAPPVEPPSIQERLLWVCQDRGYGEDCARALLGMAWKESNFIATAVGDHGKARGWFQIHYRLHKITTECAEDLECSADWTISYLERNGYPKYVNYAVQCHNGCNIANGYAASALRHGKRLWNHEEMQLATAN